MSEYVSDPEEFNPFLIERGGSVQGMGLFLGYEEQDQGVFIPDAKLPDFLTALAAEVGLEIVVRKPDAAESANEAHRESGLGWPTGPGTRTRRGE